MNGSPGSNVKFARYFLNPSSLQFRLTLEVAILWVVGVSSVAVWAGWKMQQMLIATHAQQVEYTAERFPRDVELYSEMLPVKVGVQKTIHNISESNLLIWVSDPTGKTLAQSAGMDAAFTGILMSLADMPLRPQVYQVSDRYFVLCKRPLIIQGKPIGTVYLAQNVTVAQRQLTQAIQGLTAVCILALLLIITLITLRIRRALQPLQEMSRMASLISPDDLGKARIQLTHAPSEVKDLAQTFDIMLLRLSESWEQQREFVSNVSHELRTPLTIVSGYLQSVLRRSTNLNEYQQEALETASSEANRTIRLLEDLLEFARADSGQLHLHVEPVVLNALVAEVADMTKKFSHRQVPIESTTDVIARVDRDRLKQILLNLIDNAMKYSNPDRPIKIKVHSSGDKALIQVSDQGIGIPLLDQSRIFERFYRVDQARTRTTGGYGLGLAVVKTMVEEMGGRITVESKLSKGSTFTIYLPGLNTATV
ncbi:sensor histidine kinase [Phormidium tenue]|uniref:histidine kinase n=1 Tax=Phormidium tenue NIES-30 TaxID=549789 RepID=A0A1U7IYH4_9CYAN|nr:HAMP domain-containing sensor histidine kinase [Phormidium tenue]MBD2234889.1 HAMP domain-containing histidine kinase [Phormidium tenue FACHB-1052]OKH43628.1 two-component sensor histidine kinase [Phormidium tenue NIES-30]